MRDARRKPIAAAVLLGLAHCWADAFADTVIVDSCNDPLFPVFETTLRSAIAQAQENDTVDLSGLACSTITLEQGELVIEQNSLGLLGPYDHELSIDAHGESRAINHVGTGDLYIAYVSATYGAASGVLESGGCIRSSGTLHLLHATLSHCTAYRGGGAFASEVRAAYAQIASNSATLGGGGLASDQYLFVEHSDVLGNHADHYSDSKGGGLYSRFNNIVVKDSNISNNASTRGGALATYPYSASLTRATISGNMAGLGGGVYAYSLSVADCTVDNNFATLGRGGGLYATHHLEIVGSTISGNKGGGAFSYSTLIRNSTIVRNTAPTASPYGTAGGVLADYATIISSIVANNSVAGAGPADVVVNPGGLTAYTSLIRSASEPTLSLTVDPRLGPLADHGGGRRTHAVLPGSPVIDLGSNPLNLQSDERGLPRVVNLKPDIGAYERQVVDDQLLYDGFDSS